MNKTTYRVKSLVAALVMMAAMVLAGPALAKTCAEEMVIIKAEIDAMPTDSDKRVAEHQFKKAQERQEAGKEQSCLRYLGSARAAIEADRMHNN